MLQGMRGVRGMGGRRGLKRGGYEGGGGGGVDCKLFINWLQIV